MWKSEASLGSFMQIVVDEEQASSERSTYASNPDGKANVIAMSIEFRMI